MESKIMLIYSKFHYIEKRQSDRQDIITTHNLEDNNKEFHKKVTLLQHFKSYLEGEDKAKNPDSAVDHHSGNIPIYVKKWMRTRHAIVFRLSNKVVQVSFEDHTEIILCSESREVIYINKKGEIHAYPLSTAMEEPNTEMTKRLKYTKDILTHMLTAGQAKPSDSQRGQGSSKGTTVGAKEPKPDK